MYLENLREAVLSSLYLFYFQVTLHISGVSHTHHARICTSRYVTLAMAKVTYLLIHGFFLIGFYHYIFKFMTCTSYCNYSLCTPGDGSGRHPKHVE